VVVVSAKYSRRKVLKLAGVGAGAAVLSRDLLRSTAVRAQSKATEIVHWSWYSASDNTDWSKLISNFNDAHKDKGVQIRQEFVPDDTYGTKLLASAATGNAPDFGTAQNGRTAQWAKQGVTLPIEAPVKQAGLDLSDFDKRSLDVCTYYGKLMMLPMDVSSMAVLLNVPYAKAAGLDVTKPPKTGAELIDWAQKMTVKQGGTITRSGWMQSGSGALPLVVWSVVAYQMGFRRASADLKEAGVNPQAGAQAAQWVLDMWDKHQVSTREIAGNDRYRAFGAGAGAMFFTGPWAIRGYADAKLDFMSFPIPKIGNDTSSYYEVDGIEMYVQKDTSRYAATAAALKWLSDNSVPWVTTGRVDSPRKSIRASAAFRNGGWPQAYKGGFIDGMAEAQITDIPLASAEDFEIYGAGIFPAKVMDQVWAKQMTPSAAMTSLTEKWQADLKAG
jgi:multiple sugar transport system substrate-binding protein